MRLLSTKLYLALNVVLFLACHGRKSRPICGIDITRHYGLKKRALEPILQQLVKAGILSSIQGQGGGYYVVAPDRVTLHDIMICFIDGPLPEEEAFREFIPILQPHLDQSYESWTETLSRVTIRQLCDEASTMGLTGSRNPVLDYTI